MASMGSLRASIAQVTNDLTVTAANFNLDFTLVKCEAPREFHELGNALSQRRKDNAESGSTHITAQRLGALFKDAVPNTPNLLAAYGTRVSEIAQAAKQAALPEAENSMLAAHAGFDGTSIWAAATSSTAALTVQLLACMLARVWSASEATSVWVEIVKERRQEIEGRFHANEPQNLATVNAAAQADIPRTSLAEWDASARSWLRTADRVQMKLQDQLMLLIANIRVSISQEQSVFESVVAAWTSALQSMEKLVSGMPQAVNEGSCLLALSAWHLYPDIVLEGSSPVSHMFQDPLVGFGGTLTLGLARPGGGDVGGVFWCLSLAHLNHYGRPVRKKASLDLQSHKFTFDEFLMASFGAFLGYWRLCGHLADSPCSFFMRLRDAIQRAGNDPQSDALLQRNCAYVLGNTSHWINLFAKTAAAYMDIRDFRDDLMHNLISLGERKATAFLGNGPRSSFLGFGELDFVLDMLKGTKERITFLRRLIRLQARPERVLIRYFDNCLSRSFCGIATGLPQPYGSSTRHVRWTPGSLVWMTANPLEVIPGELVCELPPEASKYIGSKETTFTLVKDYAEAGPVHQTYTFVCGSGNAAIFVEESGDNSSVDAVVSKPTMEDLVWCLDADMFNVNKLLAYFASGYGEDASPEIRTLNALSVAHKIYRSLPEATFSTRVLARPLYQTHWASEHRETQTEIYDLLNTFTQQGQSISKEIAFACVAYMESGCDIDLGSMRHVFAIAYEDSIYVSMRLTCDPWELPQAHELKRVAGNIGKPGFTLLVPPEHPDVAIQDESSWRLISNRAFDGRPEDCFTKTSMHLSFTHYYVPLVQVEMERGQDSQVYLLESVVSIHHEGKWIGDVDVYKCLDSIHVSRWDEEKCPCSARHAENDLALIQSVENWEDIISPPPRDAVIRANGNWVARLAAATIFVQARMQQEDAVGFSDGLTILPSSACGFCLPRYGLACARRNSSPFLARTHQVIRLFVY